MSDHLLFNLLVEFFEEDNWDFQWMAGMSVLTLHYNGASGKWVCYAQAREEQQQLVYYSVIPVNVPEAKRPLMAEFITRVNYGMVIGNFEMDYEDGEIRYKTSVDVEGTPVTLPLIRQLVYANISITDHYFPAIMRVLYGNEMPVDVLKDLYLESQQLLDEHFIDDDKPTTTKPEDEPDDIDDDDLEDDYDEAYEDTFGYLEDDDFEDDDDDFEAFDDGDDDDFEDDDDDFDLFDDDEPSTNGKSPH